MTVYNPPVNASVKGREFHYQLSDFQLLKNDSAL
jgi:hypothetical protein